MNSDKLRVAEIEGEDVAQGIISAGSFITKLFTLDETTVNVHRSEYSGIGPRYGMLPAPFQGVFGPSDPNVSYISSNSLQPQSLAKGKFTNQLGCFHTNRRRIYAVYPVRMQQFDNDFVNSPMTSQGLTYFFISDTVVPPTFPSAGSRLLTIGYTGKPFFQSNTLWISRHGSGFNKGVLADGYSLTSSNFNLNNFRLGRGNRSRILPASPNYLRTAFSSIVGVDNKLGNIVGSSNFQALTNAPRDWVFNAYAKEVTYGTFDKNNSYYEVIVVGEFGGSNKPELYKRFVYNSLGLTSGSDATRSLIGDYGVDYALNNANISVSADSVTNGTNASSINSNIRMLFKNSNFKINSSYNVFCVAAENPICAIFQEWVHQRGSDASERKPSSMQYFDPTENHLFPLPQATTGYTEAGVSVATGFSAFPAFVPGTALQPDATTTRDGTALQNYCLGAANTGLLRANTVYELAFTLFDKSTNVESNLCTPVKFQTGSADFTRISVYRQQTTGSKPELTNAGQAPLRPIPTGGFVVESHIEIRFYYRTVGSFDWLPTLSVDYAQFYYDPTIKTLWACESPIARLPGPQSGAFNDKSPLPKDKWFDVVFFQGFCFWMSPKAISYSNKFDPFTYPILNAVNISKGYCKGMIEHAYPGQSTQSSRLLVFTSEGIYAGRFDGNFVQMQVRVDPNTSATFDRPGSDFNLSFWTSNIAFSSRAAVVARGILFYWGPNGLYMDAGSEIPSKDFSLKIEPFIHKCYDTARTDDIHAVYNDITKEVIWFFPPKPTGTQSKQKALVYHVETGAFFVLDFGETIVDSAQLVDVQTPRTNNTDYCGQRVALYVRNTGNITVQEMVFFDDLCDSGDLRPDNILFCIGVEVAGPNRRIQVSRNNFSQVLPTSGRLTVDQYNAYTDTALNVRNPDGIYNIVGGDGATYFDIAPIGGSWVSATDFEITTITDRFNDPSICFPVQVESVNGFNYRILSDYYLPGNMQDWWRFVHCHQVYRVDQLVRSATPQTVRLKFRSVLGSETSDRDVPLDDNSRGMCQAFSQINFVKQNHESQAISIELTAPSGRFCGSRWKLQYLSYHCLPMSQGSLRTFER